MMGAMLKSGQMPSLSMMAAACVFVALAIIAGEIRRDGAPAPMLLLAGCAAGFALAMAVYA